MASSAIRDVPLAVESCKLQAFFAEVRSLVFGVAAVGALEPQQFFSPGIVRPLVLGIALCLCVTMPLSQLVFMVIGAVAYLGMQSLQVSNPKHPKKGLKNAIETNTTVGTKPVAAASALRPALPKPGVCEQQTWSPTVRTPSKMPVANPSFTSKGWEAEIQELLAQILPTPETELIVKRLADVVREVIKRSVPEAEVLSYVSGNLSARRAFGVAVPDVDIVISACPTVLVARLQGSFSSRTRGGGGGFGKLDARQLQKLALRAFTDRLGARAGFKFRRSAFRCQEPKVTLLAPSTLGICGEAVPVDFSVNSVCPVYNAAILTECGQLDPRAKALIFLIRRWARDRGISHAAKGHLSPYIWGLLAIYYLQVGVQAEGTILPPLEAFKALSELISSEGSGAGKIATPNGDRCNDGCSMSTCTGSTDPSVKTLPQPQQRQASVNGPREPIGDLLKGFFHFYTRRFEWGHEAICVRLGRRGPPDIRLPIHIVENKEKGTTNVGPNIEDPFDLRVNLGACLNHSSLLRFHQELKRAQSVCSQGESLSSLLEPWKPGLESTGDDSVED